MTHVTSIHTPSELLARAREYVPELAAGAVASDREGKLVRDIFQRLHASGVLSLIIRSQEGGAGGGLADALRVVSTLAEGDPSVALVVAMYYNQHGAIAFGNAVYSAPLVKKLVASALAGPSLINAAYVEPRVGSASHGAVPETVARRDGAGWRLSGHKKYVTGSTVLSWLRVMGVTDEAEQRVGYFLVPADAPGVTIVPVWDALGMRGTESNDIVFKDVWLPEDHFFGWAPLEQGLPTDPRGSSWYLLLVGAVYHGIAQAARNAIVDFANRTEPGGLGAPLATLPRFQDAIGEIEVLQTTARRVLLSIAREHDENTDSGTLRAIHQDAEVGRLVAIENALKATSIALDLAGNQGVSRNNAFERYHRDVLAARAHHPQPFLIRSNRGHAALGLGRGTPLRNGAKRAEAA